MKTQLFSSAFARSFLAAALALSFAAPAAAQHRRPAPARPPSRPVAGEDGRVMAELARISATLRTSTYSHSTRVDVARGRYDFDCSGMTAWVLARVAPRAHRAVAQRAARGRPLARDYYQQLAAAPATRPANGWLGVRRVADARPGDVIAWVRPPESRSPNTGHVAFVVASPVPIEGSPGAYLVRIADASSYQHEDDTRYGTGRTGFGFGTILVAADPETGAPRAYGWHGRRSWGLRATRIAFGRPTG